MNETIKHLELIETIVNRMSQASFIIKGWTITLVVALLAVAANTLNSWYGLLALIATCVFWGLDAYYLRQERLYRCLYEKVRLGPNESNIPAFSMDTTDCRVVVDSWFQTLRAPTIIVLYGVLLALVVIAVVVIKPSA